MRNSAFFRNLYTKCKMHGAGDAQVVISDGELYSLISIAIDNLDWSHTEIGVDRVVAPNNDYYKIPLSWFDQQAHINIESNQIEKTLRSAFEKDNDFGLFIENLSALHRRRVKYRRILAEQPMPTMDQIGPRSLLEYGCCESALLANWMVWRKWIYDVDNRSAQETGYLFEPLLASCLGGEPVGAKNSPVKRLDSNGTPTKKGRQIDCLVPSNNRTYELKLRVTIAASGQGRFGEELSFAEESQAAGFIPVLLVLDPTPSSRLTELSEKYISCGGEFYHGEAAWQHMEEEAGDVISVFIEKYIRPAIQGIEEVEISLPKSINLSWSDDEIKVSDNSASYVVKRG
ncbi:hypothetical protein [Thiohalophilus thiocyanatoxydans]|uniref:ApaLI-like restriction endonuclease n=1 Tax=Thiohalophilus thiocyanatoxydans TaxID=381308 RepID=A0A4R8IKU9_9GAMM|nr:hypothetical protein [Thiohalophilus thiocyanatoxydans]TDX99659.1 hypothetical protein EDC23_2446 [Thiohalophilus thiocyanatoxydans]